MIEIYTSDGTVQCGSADREIPLDAMAAELKKIGLHVRGAEKRKFPGQLAQWCGNWTGHCNVFQIEDADWEKFKTLLVKIGFRLWSSTKMTAERLGGDDLFPWPWRPQAGPEDGYPLSASLDGPGEGDGFPLSAVSSGPEDPFPLGGLPRRVDNSVPLNALLGKRVRVYNKGDMITRDFRFDRVNLELQPNSGFIVDVWFG